MVDIGSGAVPLRRAWAAFGHRAAVIAGALAALTALIRHVPVRVASLRGALAWAAVLLVSRASLWLLQRTSLEDQPPELRSETPDAQATKGTVPHEGTR